MTEHEWLQRERGICSNRDCDEPIAGWCATCDAKGPFKAPKLCMEHLAEHTVAALHAAWSPYGEVRQVFAAEDREIARQLDKEWAQRGGR